MSATSQTPSGIAYDRQGPPGQIPVVLLHAGIADRRMWDPLWEDLTAQRDAVRLDLRGYGQSTSRPHGPVDHVADVVEAVDHLGLPRCHLVGASFGAGVAVEVALTQPDRVRSLLLCPPGGSLLATLTPSLKSFVDVEREALARGDLDAAVEANVTTWVIGPGRDGTALDSALLGAVRDMQRRAFDIAEEWGDVDTVELDPPALERLSDVSAPLLVLVGGRDLDTTHDAAERLEAGTKRFRRVDWEDVAHLPTMERPADFLALLLDWIDAAD